MHPIPSRATSILQWNPHLRLILGTVHLSFKLKKISNGSNSTLKVLTWNHWNWILRREYLKSKYIIWGGSITFYFCLGPSSLQVFWIKWLHFHLSNDRRFLPYRILHIHESSTCLLIHFRLLVSLQDGTKSALLFMHANGVYDIYIYSLSLNFTMKNKDAWIMWWYTDMNGLVQCKVNLVWKRLTLKPTSSLPVICFNFSIFSIISFLFNAFSLFNSSLFLASSASFLSFTSCRFLFRLSSHLRREFATVRGYRLIYNKKC